MKWIWPSTSTDYAEETDYSRGGIWIYWLSVWKGEMSCNEWISCLPEGRSRFVLVAVKKGSNYSVKASSASLSINNDALISINIIIQCSMWARIVLSGWTVQGLKPSGGKIFHSHPVWPWGLPSLMHDGYRVSFSGVKQMGHGVNLPPPQSAEVRERVWL